MHRYHNVKIESLKGLFLLGAEDPVDPATPPPDPTQVVAPEPGTTPDPDPATPPEVTFSLEDVKKLREEAAKYRTERNTLQKEKDEKAKAEMAEVDRLKLEKEEADTRVKEIETQLATERIGNAISRAASTASFFAPDDAAAFIKASDIKLLEDGTPDMRSVKAAVETLAKDKPHLVRGPGSGDGGWQSAPPNRCPENQAIRRRAKGFWNGEGWLGRPPPPPPIPLERKQE